MKNIEFYVPESWKQKFRSGDWMLMLIVAIIVGSLIVAFVYSNNGSGHILEQQNKSLSDSVQRLNRRIDLREQDIQKRDREIEFMNKELAGVIRIVDSLSTKYKTQKRKNETSVETYRRLSADQRLREFANLLSGQN